MVLEERLTWEQIQEKYSEQWVGLLDVKYEENDGITIESAIVGYTGLSMDDLTKMMLHGKCVARYTTPDHVFSLEMIEVLSSTTRSLKGMGL